MSNHLDNRMQGFVLRSLLLAAIFALPACSADKMAPELMTTEVEEPADGTVEITARQFEAAGMQLGNIAQTSFRNTVKATGMLDVPPQYRATVNSYFGGTVQHLKLIPGEYVNKGQRLFSLENPDFVQVQQDYLEAKGQLAYLKADYERQKNLSADNVASQKSFLKAESEYTVTRVRVESLAKRLGLMGINPESLSIDNLRTSLDVLAPISGYVTAVLVTRGVFLPAAEPALTIINTEHLHLELNIFEKDLAKVKVGQHIEFALQEETDRPYNAKVHLVNRSVDEANRTIRVHGHLDDELLSDGFSPGMYVEADIYANSQLKSSLPESALVEVEGSYYALVLQDSTAGGYVFAERVVEVGEMSEGYVEVLNAKDFEAGTHFLTKGGFNLIGE